MVFAEVLLFSNHRNQRARIVETMKRFVVKVSSDRSTIMKSRCEQGDRNGFLNSISTD